MEEVAVTQSRAAEPHPLPPARIERGFTAPQGRRKLEHALTTLLDATDEQGSVTLSPRTLVLVKDMRTGWAELDQRIRAYDDEFAALAKADATNTPPVSLGGPAIAPENSKAKGVGEATRGPRRRHGRQ